MDFTAVDSKMELTEYVNTMYLQIKYTMVYCPCMTNKEIILKALDLIENGIVNENRSMAWAVKAYDLDVEKIRQAKTYIFNTKI